MAIMLGLPSWDPVKESTIVPDTAFHQLFQRLKLELENGHFPEGQRPASAIIARLNTFFINKDGKRLGPYYIAMWTVNGKRYKKYLGTDRQEAMFRLQELQILVQGTC